MWNFDWPALGRAVLKIVTVAIVGAGTGFQTTGTWQGAALGAGMGVGGLLIKRPTLTTPAPEAQKPPS